MTSLQPSSEIVRQVQKQANRSNQCNKQPVQPVKKKTSQTHEEANSLNKSLTASCPSPIIFLHSSATLKRRGMDAVFEKKRIPIFSFCIVACHFGCMAFRLPVYGFQASKGHGPVRADYLESGGSVYDTLDHLPTLSGGWTNAAST